jgi:hypothetical protein
LATSAQEKEWSVMPTGFGRFLVDVSADILKYSWVGILHRFETPVGGVKSAFSRAVIMRAK